jgi:hypothetical protein
VLFLLRERTTAMTSRPPASVRVLKGDHQSEMSASHDALPRKVVHRGAQ